MRCGAPGGIGTRLGGHSTHNGESGIPSAGPPKEVRNAAAGIWIVPAAAGAMGGINV